MSDPIESTRLTERSLALNLIDVARHVFSKAELRTLWADMKLPFPSKSQPATDEPQPSSGAADVARFFREACTADPRIDVPAETAFRSFTAWALREGVPGMSYIAFGKFAAKAGVRSRKAKGAKRYLGFRLPG